LSSCLPSALDSHARRLSPAAPGTWGGGRAGFQGLGGFGIVGDGRWQGLLLGADWRGLGGGVICDGKVEFSVPGSPRHNPA
jgi:hypothetical protein